MSGAYNHRRPRRCPWNADRHANTGGYMANDNPGGPDHEAHVRAYTIRLELVDEPGELLNALEPIASSGGNLLSIHHERGSVTPRGRIPVEVDLECVPDRFDEIVDGLRDAGITVIQAGEERYSEAVTVLLVGHLVDTDLSDTLERLERSRHASLLDCAVSTPQDREDVSSARIRLAVERDEVPDVLDSVRLIASEKNLRVIEPQLEEGA